MIRHDIQVYCTETEKSIYRVIFRGFAEYVLALHIYGSFTSKGSIEFQRLSRKGVDYEEDKR